MKNHLVREPDPPLLGEDLDQILLDLHRVGVLRQIQPPGDPRDVRVHHHSGGDPIGGAQHHVRRLARRSRDGEHLFHGLRHLAAEDVDHALRGADDRLRLVIEESRAAYVVRQHLRTHCGEIPRRGVLGEEGGRNFIDALIGALRGQNGGHQQLPRIAMR